jgi:uncharacterized protein (TIGR01777 family)
MKVLVTGASGLIGSALLPRLVEHGHVVTRVTRSASASGASPTDTIVWDPRGQSLDASRFRGFDAAVHLAGENLASGRWTTSRKEEIRVSRVRGTRLLSHTLAQLDKPPSVLISASAIGIYGDRGDELLTESSSLGTGFLAELCHDWEQATQPARDKGIRVVLMRTGVVLSPRGGALKKMLPPFKLGLGGKIGGGRQYMSWVGIDDIAQIIVRALEDPSLSGPVNGVAPEPVTNAEFTKTLGRVLARPTFFSMPAAAARLAFGEMADEALLASARVTPQKLIASGYAFASPKLEPCLRQLLSR